ncbi:MAG: hypothetical protein ACP5N0_14000 [Methanosarcina sp.]
MLKTFSRNTSIMHAEPTSEIWKFLTEEQKKKFALMKMNLKIQLMETKINNMEKMTEPKKKAIDNIINILEIIKQGK